MNEIELTKPKSDLFEGLPEHHGMAVSFLHNTFSFGLNIISFLNKSLAEFNDYTYHISPHQFLLKASISLESKEYLLIRILCIHFILMLA